MLELCGIATVIVDLNDRLRQLNQPTLVGHVRSWLASAPPFPSKPDSASTGHAPGDSTALGLSEVAWVWDKAVDTSPEARLDVLEKNVERLRKVMTVQHNELGNRSANGKRR